MRGYRIIFLFFICYIWFLPFVHADAPEIMDQFKSSFLPFAVFFTALLMGFFFFVKKKKENGFYAGKQIDQLPENQTVLENNLKVQIEKNQEMVRQIEMVEQRNQKLLEENEELKKFGYMATHDLKEPLRTIGSYASLINRRYKDHLDEDGRQFFGFITEGINRMHNLLNEVLNYSGIENSIKEGEIHVIDTAFLINELQQNLQKQIEDKNAQLIIHDLPEIKADRNHLVHIFQNLISNGLKYNDKEIPTIQISSRAVDGYNIFEIEDNGIGIDMEFKNRIFEVFQRLHSKDEFEGTGIGLAIVKKLINNYGGQIWMESEKGKGSKFSFSFPMVQVAEAAV